MLSLPQVLHEAESHSVDEIVIEPGQPVTFHGEQGALVLGERLGEAMISDALSQLLGPDEQAELAVTGLVEFHVEGHGEWSLVAESRGDGVVIRGRVRRGVDSLGTPLDLPPLAPFESDGDRIPSAPGSALRQTHAGGTRWDVAAVGSVIDPMPSEANEALELTPLPESRRYRTSRGFPPQVPAPALADASIDFALVGPLEASEAADGEVGAKPQVGTRSTKQDVDAVGGQVGVLEPGTLVYLTALGAGERMLQDLEDGFQVIDLENWDIVTTRPLGEMAPPASGYLVRLEDPSQCLAWLLRRLEEGGRVVMETRSRTAAGARRALLGVGATAHAVAWLDAHAQLWLHPDGDAWLTEPLVRDDSLSAG